MQWYIVGGAVRDLVLGKKPADTDFAFEGTVQDMLKAYPAACKVGKSVEVCMLHGKECMPLAGGRLDTDLAARDLTINALALENNGRLHVHPQALHDLREGLLRPASDRAFFDDPVRIYRLARFAALFPDFRLHDDALFQARAVVEAGLHRPLPAERVGNEMRKALACPRPSRFLDTLAAIGAFEHWFQELEGAQSIPAGPLPWHTGSVLAHTGTIMDALAGNALTVWMALCHDIGKIATPKDMLPHHYGHEERGELAACDLAQRLALPTRYAIAGMVAAREHMKGGLFHTLRMGTRRDVLHRVHCAHLDEPFWHLVNADSGQDIRTSALQYLHVMLDVQLPEEWRNQGKRSGEHLRLLQCDALARVR